MLGTGKIISVAKDIRIRQNEGADGGRKTIALVCPKHGFRRGSECADCATERSKKTVHINTGECYRGGTSILMRNRSGLRARNIWLRNVKSAAYLRKHC